MFLKRLRAPQPLPNEEKLHRQRELYVDLAAKDGGYPKSTAGEDFDRMVRDPRIASLVLNPEKRTLYVGTVFVSISDGVVRRKLGEFIISFTRNPENPSIEVENLNPIIEEGWNSDGVMSRSVFHHPHMSGARFCSQNVETAKMAMKEGNIARAVILMLDAIFTFDRHTCFGQETAAQRWPIDKGANHA